MPLRLNARGRWEEVVPDRCRNGHRLGVGRMTNSMGENPDHRGSRVRTWTCRQCGDVSYDEPDDPMPRGQAGPTADYR